MNGCRTNQMMITKRNKIKKAVKKSRKNEEEEKEEVARGSTEAEVTSPKEGFFRRPSSPASQVTEETSEDEEPLSSVRAPRAKKRKSDGFTGYQLDLAEEMKRISDTSPRNIS